MTQYELTVGEDYRDEENITRTSLVERPATNKLFAVFSSEEPTDKHEFQVLPTRTNQQVVAPKDNKFERVISGVWFMPDTDYPRIYKDDLGNDVVGTASMTSEELKLAVKNFVKSGKMNEFDIMHNGEKVEGLKTMEVWMLYDYNQYSPILLNTIETLGYAPEDIPLGTVFMTVFIENEQFFNEMILSGQVKGFSIEGLFNRNLKQEKQEMEIDNKNRSLFSELGLSQKEGTLITNQGNLMIVNDEIKLDEKSVVDGSFKLSNKFSIEVRQGKVVDFGFEEVEPVVGDSTTANAEAVVVNEVPTVTVEKEVEVEVKDTTEVVETTVDNNTTEVEVKETTEVVKDNTPVVNTTEVKEEVEVISTQKDDNTKLLATKDAEIEALKAELEAANKAKEEALKSQPIPKRNKYNDKPSDFDSNKYIVKKVGGKDFYIPNI